MDRPVGLLWSKRTREFVWLCYHGCFRQRLNSIFPSRIRRKNLFGLAGRPNARKLENRPNRHGWQFCMVYPVGSAQRPFRTTPSKNTQKLSPGSTNCSIADAGRLGKLPRGRGRPVATRGCLAMMISIPNKPRRMRVLQTGCCDKRWRGPGRKKLL